MKTLLLNNTLREKTYPKQPSYYVSRCSWTAWVKYSKSAPNTIFLETQSPTILWESHKALPSPPETEQPPWIRSFRLIDLVPGLVYSPAPSSPRLPAASSAVAPCCTAHQVSRRNDMSSWSAFGPLRATATPIWGGDCIITPNEQSRFKLADEVNDQ